MIMALLYKNYTYSYTEMREHYQRVIAMTDEEFKESLPEINHLTCAICFFKEIKADRLLRDDGIIHQLAHLMHIADEPILNIQIIRNLWKTECELV